MERLADFTRSAGLAELGLPVPITAFMAAPILHRGVRAGSIFVASNEPGRAFTRRDEEALVLFASQAARVLANARTHREERRATGPTSRPSSTPRRWASPSSTCRRGRRPPSTARRAASSTACGTRATSGRT